jgi:hypothetical protein
MMYRQIQPKPNHISLIYIHKDDARTAYQVSNSIIIVIEQLEICIETRIMIGSI